MAKEILDGRKNPVLRLAFTATANNNVLHSICESLGQHNVQVITCPPTLPENGKLIMVSEPPLKTQAEWLARLLKGNVCGLVYC